MSIRFDTKWLNGRSRRGAIDYKKKLSSKDEFGKSAHSFSPEIIWLGIHHHAPDFCRVKKHATINVNRSHFPIMETFDYRFFFFFFNFRSSRALCLFSSATILTVASIDWIHSIHSAWISLVKVTQLDFCLVSFDFISSKGKRAVISFDIR